MVTAEVKVGEFVAFSNREVFVVNCFAARGREESEREDGRGEREAFAEKHFGGNGDQESGASSQIERCATAKLFL